MLCIVVDTVVEEPARITCCSSGQDGSGSRLAATSCKRYHGENQRDLIG